LEDLHSLSKVWDLIIHISERLDIQTFLDKNQYDNVTIQEALDQELNLEENFGIERIKLEYLKTLGDVLTNCLDKIKKNSSKGQTELSGFLSDLCAYQEKQKDKEEFLNKFRALGEEGLKDKLEKLIKARTNSMREVATTMNTVFWNCVYYFTLDPETFDFSFIIK
jgi:hypothetical protein